METLQDRVALVTGVTAYIGRAAAQELARRGARVVVNGRTADTGAHGQGMIDNLRRRMLFPVRCADIAQAAAFLAGPGSDAITGQTLSVNGGLSTPG